MIRLHQVVKHFREPLLQGVNLHLPAGSVWGLVGPAASGKSVLLKLICGLLPADAGTIEVAGQQVSDANETELMRIRARIGMLFQNNALFDFMTVLENVAFPLIRQGTPREEAEQRAAERLRAVGLAGSEHKAPAELSGGMKKRLGIARASVAHPTMVIYDEPTAGLDPVTTRKIYDLLQADQDATGTTTIVVSSDVDGLRRFVPRLGMLYEGRLRYDGPAESMADSEDAVVRQFIRGELEGPL